MYRANAVYDLRLEVILEYVQFDMSWTLRTEIVLGTGGCRNWGGGLSLGTRYLRSYLQMK